MERYGYNQGRLAPIKQDYKKLDKNYNKHLPKKQYNKIENIILMDNTLAQEEGFLFQFKNQFNFQDLTHTLPEEFDEMGEMESCLYFNFYVLSHLRYFASQFNENIIRTQSQEFYQTIQLPAIHLSVSQQSSYPEEYIRTTSKLYGRIIFHLLYYKREEQIQLRPTLQTLNKVESKKGPQQNSNIGLYQVY
ncbi:hypothetical protein PPERSA_06130 [Pseudocohnilembus persalinus]|uniref:Uncharacterized protein n=1 Tax=Pseudocohnilembus persalinus TaxID=266149 RepID=A0A0V0QWC7_PSEPJ|nr:hypothetical protein PPERSA_06130 [Pseudocohnilembus persalinus]|eukprot:KRX06248.1 hypothetical protein PPERSA_06130 [Pseudocohnilembus persalinus]